MSPDTVSPNETVLEVTITDKYGNPITTFPTLILPLSNTSLNTTTGTIVVTT